MTNTHQHPKIITDYLEKERTLGRLLGPFPPMLHIPELHINRFGVIPKGHNTGKWRLITDLSHPPGQTANDGIDPIICSLTYTSMDQVAECIVHLGSHTMLAKVDIESAFRLVPVHPQDRPLLGVRWDDQLFIDPLKIFNAMADALHWYLGNRGVPHIFHYLDDFIFLGALTPLNVKTPCSHLTKSARSWEYLLQNINGMDQQTA